MCYITVMNYIMVISQNVKIKYYKVCNCNMTKRGQLEGV